MEYRREIDGLRALAVIPVMFFHAGFQAFSGGFVGVDVFFVISGYLITSIILAEKHAGTFSIVNFYERRARRILPALFFMMLVCLPFAWLWLLPEDMKSFSQSLVAVSGFASNILFFWTTNYFSTAAEFKPLLHTWSLAVEEQYYLLFPLFLILGWRWGKRWLITALAVIAVFSLVAAQWSSFKYPVFAFFLLPTRAWEILIGALAAFYLFANNKNDKTVLGIPIGELASVVGFLLIVYAVCMFDKKTPSPSLYILVPTVGVVLIILFATSQTLIGKFLGSKLLVGVGLISYSAYLWHQPLFAFARHRNIYEPSKSLLINLLVASILFAYLSWKYIEMPFRGRQRIKRNQVFWSAALCSIFFISFGLLGSLNKGYPNSFNRVSNEVLTFSDIDMPRIDNGWCFYSVDSINSLPVGDQGLKCVLGDKNSPVKGLLFGDSYAAQYEPFWNIIGEKSAVSIKSITTNWCYPALTDQFIGLTSSRAYAQCLWDRRYLAEYLSNYDFVIFGGNWAEVNEQNKISDVYDMIAHAVNKTQLVIIMASPSQFDSDVGLLYKKSVFYKEKFDIKKIAQHRNIGAIEMNKQLEELSKKNPNILYIDQNSLFHVDGLPSDLSRANIPYSFDGKHISIYGSKQAAYSFLKTGRYSEYVEKISQLKPVAGK